MNARGEHWIIFRIFFTRSLDSLSLLKEMRGIYSSRSKKVFHLWNLILDKYEIEKFLWLIVIVQWFGMFGGWGAKIIFFLDIFSHLSIFMSFLMFLMGLKFSASVNSFEQKSVRNRIFIEKLFSQNLPCEKNWISS